MSIFVYIDGTTPYYRQLRQFVAWMQVKAEYSLVPNREIAIPDSYVGMVGVSDVRAPCSIIHEGKHWNHMSFVFVSQQ